VHGVSAFRADLDRMLDLTDATADALSKISGITIATAGPLSIVTFAADAGEAATRQILEHLNASGDVHVSSTMLGEQFVIRAAFLSQRTSTSIAQRLTELVAEAVAHT
jgi:hypothetical protein